MIVNAFKSKLRSSTVIPLLKESRKINGTMSLRIKLNYNTHCFYTKMVLILYLLPLKDSLLQIENCCCNCNSAVGLTVQLDFIVCDLYVIKY
jgi:hypothetical protein